MAGNKIGTDFTTGNMRKHLWVFVTPFLISSILNSAYNATDMVIIGQLAGEIGTVAVHQGGKMLTLFTLVSTSFSFSGQVMIGQMLGAKKEKELNETIGTMFSLLIGISVIIAAAVLAFSNQIIDILDVPEAAAQETLGYLRITCIGLPLTFAYNAVSTVLRGMGESKLPLYFIAIAAGFNIIGDIVFIVVFNMGVAGTAVATVMGQALSLVISVSYLYKRRDKFGFDFKLKSFKIVPDKAKTIIKVGAPLAARSFFIQASQIVLLKWINNIDAEDAVSQAAAWGVADKFISLTNIVAVAVKSAGGSIVAQNLGAGKTDRCKSLVRNALLLNMAVAAVISAAISLFPKFFFRLLVKDDAVIAYAPPIMYLSVIVFILSGVASAFDTVINGSGNSGLSFLEGVLDGVVLRMGLGFLFGNILGMQVVGFYLGNALARISPTAISFIYYLSGAWARRKKLV